jgi:hypothetical protein
MASPLNAVFCALVAVVFWTVPGYALARRVLPRSMAFGAAPVVGWASFSAATLPLLTLIGFSAPAIITLAVCAFVIAAASLRLRDAASEAEPHMQIPGLGFAAAAVLALVPASAIVPKIAPGGVHLADPIFDHAKIAIIDAMARQGVPPINPVFGEGGFAYYYLWHFSAAELALPLHVSGWEADIALTWFTAFASLALMMGVAVRLGKKPAAAFAVVALAAAASLRETTSLAFGSYSIEPLLQSPTGFAGWLFQAAWAPQHLMAAGCVVTAIVLLTGFAERQSASALVTIVLIVAAGFESSAYVGGVTFAAAATIVAPILLATMEPKRRGRFVVGLALAAVLTLCLVAPFIRDQWATIAARGGGSPLAVHPVEVLGDMFAPALRRALDGPAYWVILLPIEFPAAFVAGVIALVALWRGAAAERTMVAALATLCGVGLIISWLVVSTVGDNNDLGLRAVLPATMVLIAAAAAGMLQERSRRAIAVTALGGLLLSLPDTARMAYSNIIGHPAADAQAFAQAPDLWRAVRRYAGPTMRVANNPLYLQDLTPWPANMSWALLANRNSCFAGREMALAFASLPPERREAINAQFIRVFAGDGLPEDVEDLARKYGCDVVVVVPQDGIWNNNDFFAPSRDYTLAEHTARWRIYTRAPDWRAPLGR